MAHVGPECIGFDPLDFLRPGGGQRRRPLGRFHSARVPLKLHVPGKFADAAEFLAVLGEELVVGNLVSYCWNADVLQKYPQPFYLHPKSERDAQLD